MVRLINNQTDFQSKLWKSCPWKSFSIKENILVIGDDLESFVFLLKSFEAAILVLLYCL